MGLDINERLNEIIFTYGLDSDYPNYHKGMMAESYIRELFLEFKRKNRKVLCLTNKKEDIAYFSFLAKHIGGNIEFKVFIKESAYEALDTMNLKEYDEVYAISLQYAYIVHRCQRRGIRCRSIYLDMKRKGLLFERECYRICNPDKDFSNGFNGRTDIEGLQIEHFSLKQYLDFECSAEERLFYLRNIYFLSLCMKDFLNASKYISQIMELDITDECKVKCVKSWQEIQGLLNQIKQVLKHRKQKDIIMNWMDAVGYEETENMSFLNSCRHRGINFTNAFTAMPFTHATYQTIFRGTLPLSDYFNKEKISDGKLIKGVEKYGYQFKIISGYMNWFETAYESEIWYNLGASCSEILWGELICLLNTDEPAFILGHLLLEGHHPHFYSDMISDDFVAGKSRIYRAREQMDKQLEYYTDFLSNESIIIYMSDHGTKETLLSRNHTNLIITGRDIEHKDVDGMFSYVKFSDMVLQLIQNEGTIKEDELTDDRVRLEYMDFYNGEMIYDLIRQKKMLHIFPYLGYQGIVTKDYIYAKYNIGKEVLYRRDNIVMADIEYFTLENEIEENELLPYFRGKLIDTTKVYEDKHFMYSKYLRKVYDNYKKQGSQSCDVLNQFFSAFEDDSVVLRMGGEHTVGLWRMLSTDNRKKIKCIIDRNSDCIASVLGYPIVTSMNDVDFDNVKVCVLSSFVFRKELLAEIKNFPVDVIDLYDYMKEHGLKYDDAIYRCGAASDEVYNVGFPFEDFE